MASIRKNILYSSILTLSGYIFPMIVFPYITRVLGVENLGICSFVDSTIHYFCILSMLGINTVGIREIAKYKDDKKHISKVYSSLLTLNLITTFIAIGVLLILMLTVDRIGQYREMMFIGIAKILFNSLLIEWLYKGLEDFKYITLRTVLVRAVYVVLVFILVRHPGDYDIYFGLTVAVVAVNAIINLFHSRSFVEFSFKRINVKPFVIPFLTLGLYQVLTNMYVSFNVTYLGIVTNDVEVGYYTTATKLYSIILSFFTAFTGVMLPRMSSIISQGDNKTFMHMTDKSLDALMAFVFPLIVITEVFAPQIVRIIAGEGYDGAILPMRIVMPLMFLIGYEQIIIIQMLSPMKKDKAILINSSFGAGVALLLNVLVVPKLASVGSAIVWVVAECAVTLSAQYFVRKYISFHFPLKTVLSYILISIPVLLLSCFCNNLFTNQYVSFVVLSVLVLIYYTFAEIKVIKNSLVVSYYNKIKDKCVKLFQ